MMLNRSCPSFVKVLPNSIFHTLIIFIFVNQRFNFVSHKQICYSISLFRLLLILSGFISELYVILVLLHVL